MVCVAWLGGIVAAASVALPAVVSAHSLLREHVEDSLELEMLEGGVAFHRSALATYGSPGDVDCEMGEWVVGECDAKTLTAKYTRGIKTEQAGNGLPCEATEETRKCKPVHCQMTPWSMWNACNEFGYKQRERQVETTPSGGGRECPFAVDKVKCCAGSCLVSDWSEWVCDEYSGEKTRSRTVAREQTGSGEPCPQMSETRECDPVDCEMDTEYDDWSECDVNGDRHTKLKVKTSPKHKGKPCPLDSEISKTENGYCPPEPCKYETEDDAKAALDNPFIDECTATDETKTTWVRHKEQRVIDGPKYGGTECLPFKDRWVTITDVCPPTECAYKQPVESGWGACKESETDGKWYKTQDVDLETDAVNAPPCGATRTESKECDPVNCVLESADDAKALDNPFVDECTATDETKTTWIRHKARRVTTQAEYGGTECVEGQDRWVTITDACPPTECVYKQPVESGWGVCQESETDGKWYKTQDVDLETDAVNAPPCGATRTESKECEPVSCVMDDWKYGLCNHSSGKRHNTQEVKEQSKYGAPLCSKKDVVEPCPVDCEAECKKWSECTYGTQQCEQIKVTCPAKNNGKPCPEPSDIERDCPY